MVAVVLDVVKMLGNHLVAAASVIRKVLINEKDRNVKKHTSTEDFIKHKASL